MWCKSLPAAFPRLRRCLSGEARKTPPPRRAHGSHLRWGCIMLESFVITKCYDGLDKRGSPSCVVPDSSTCGTKSITDFCVIVWIVCAAGVCVIGVLLCRTLYLWE